MAMNGIGALGGSRPIALSRSAGEPSPAEQHALVPVHAPAFADGQAPYSRRPLAPFLAHLIATAQNEPQTREFRRAAPDTAIRAYAAALELNPRNN